MYTISGAKTCWNCQHVETFIEPNPQYTEWQFDSYQPPCVQCGKDHFRLAITLEEVGLVPPVKASNEARNKAK